MKFLGLFIFLTTTLASSSSYQPKVWFDGEKDFRRLAEYEADQVGVPREIFLGLIAQESGWIPGARGRAGEVGLVQVMPATARENCLDLVQLPGGIWDPGRNLKCGARILAKHRKACGGDPCALFAYNAGLTAMRRAWPLAPRRSTADYAQRIFFYAARYL